MSDDAVPVPGEPADKGTPSRAGAAAAVLAVGTAVSPVPAARPADAEPSTDIEPDHDETTVGETVRDGDVPLERVTDADLTPAALEPDAEIPDTGDLEASADVLDVQDLHDPLGVGDSAPADAPDAGADSEDERSAGQLTSTNQAIEQSPTSRPMTEHGMASVDPAAVRPT